MLPRDFIVSIKLIKSLNFNDITLLFTNNKWTLTLLWLFRIKIFLLIPRFDKSLSLEKKVP